MILTGHKLPALNIDYVLLTPELAAEWLARNQDNRREKFVKQAAYIRDMREGRWLQTGETFKFDKAGRLIDGQNRCRAVIASGVSIPALVVTDLDAEAQGAMDSGAPRSARDALHFAGVGNSKDVAAVANVREAWRLGYLATCMSGMRAEARLTNTEMVEYVDATPDIEDVANAAKSIYTRGLRLPVGAIGTALIELGAVDEDACNDFFDRIINVRTSGTGDPVAALIKRVSELRRDRVRLMESTALFLLFRAWNAYRTGEVLKKFQLGAPAKVDPITGDKTPATWVAIPQPK